MSRKTIETDVAFVMVLSGTRETMEHEAQAILRRQPDYEILGSRPGPGPDEREVVFIRKHAEDRDVTVAPDGHLLLPNSPEERARAGRRLGDLLHAHMLEPRRIHSFVQRAISAAERCCDHDDDARATFWISIFLVLGEVHTRLAEYRSSYEWGLENEGIAEDDARLVQSIATSVSADRVRAVLTDFELLTVAYFRHRNAHLVVSGFDLEPERGAQRTKSLLGVSPSMTELEALRRIDEVAEGSRLASRLLPHLRDLFEHVRAWSATGV